MKAFLATKIYPKYALNLNDGGPMYKKKIGLVAISTFYTDKTPIGACVARERKVSDW